MTKVAVEEEVLEAGKENGFCSIGEVADLVRSGVIGFRGLTLAKLTQAVTGD